MCRSEVYGGVLLTSSSSAGYTRSDTPPTRNTDNNSTGKKRALGGDCYLIAGTQSRLRVRNASAPASSGRDSRCCRLVTPASAAAAFLWAKRPVSTGTVVASGSIAQA